MVICNMGTSYTIIETIRNVIILVELGIIVPVFILGILFGIFTIIGIVSTNIIGMFAVKNDTESKKKSFNFKRCLIIFALTVGITVFLGIIYIVDMLCYKTMIEPCVATTCIEYFFNLKSIVL